MQKRVLIVGAGPGGLASAMLLAKAGLDVKTIERMPRVGGRNSTIKAQGFRFDMDWATDDWHQERTHSLAGVG